MTMPAENFDTSIVSAPKKRERPWGLFLVIPPIALMAIFLFFPAIRNIFGTVYVEQEDGTRAWSIASYVFFFSDAYSLNNLLRTFWTTFVTLGVLIAINLPIALYLRFSQSRMAAVVQALALFPMFMPGIIIAYALIRYMGPNGVIQLLLETIGIHGYQTPYLTKWGPVIGMTWDAMPFTILVLTAGVMAIPTSAIEAARDVGAKRLRILRSIILPQLITPFLVIFSLQFLGLFSQVLMPYMLGPSSPEMMGMFMQRTFATTRDPLQASTQATVVFAICSLAGLAYVRSIARKRANEGKM